jgi:hypothetical protein
MSIPQFKGEFNRIFRKSGGSEAILLGILTAINSEILQNVKKGRHIPVPSSSSVIRTALAFLIALVAEGQRIRFRIVRFVGLKIFVERVPFMIFSQKDLAVKRFKVNQFFPDYRSFSFPPSQYHAKSTFGLVGGASAAPRRP